MIFATIETLNHYKLLIKNQRRDWFMAWLFLPESAREAAIALYALDVELEHVGHMVKEEMIGHIRYAWWRENVEALKNPLTMRDHPVLKAISQLTIDHAQLLPLVSAYSDAFPDSPQGTDGIMQEIIKHYLDKNHIEARKWEKATKVIDAHRKKYSGKNHSWLLIKLLFV